MTQAIISGRKGRVSVSMDASANDVREGDYIELSFDGQVLRFLCTGREIRADGKHKLFLERA